MPPRIFFAHPDTKIVEEVEKALTAKGYEAIATSNGTEVIRTINVNNVPHVIVLHSNLVGEPSLKICKELKQDKRTSHVPILILKGKGVDIKPYQDLKISQIIDIPPGTDGIVQKIMLLLQAIQKRRKAAQAKAKMTPAKIAGIVTIIACVLSLIFLIFIPLLSGSK